VARLRMGLRRQTKRRVAACRQLARTTHRDVNGLVPAALARRHPERDARGPLHDDSAGEHHGRRAAAADRDLRPRAGHHRLRCHRAAPLGPCGVEQCRCCGGLHLDPRSGSSSRGRVQHGLDQRRSVVVGKLTQIDVRRVTSPRIRSDAEDRRLGISVPSILRVLALQVNRRRDGRGCAGSRVRRG